MDVTTKQVFRNATIELLDKDGNPATAPLVSPPVWASSDDAVLSVAVANDGLSAVVTPVAAGAARVTVTATGGTSEDPVPLEAQSEEVVVTDPEIGVAATIRLNLGEPVEA